MWGDIHGSQGLGPGYLGGRDSANCSHQCICPGSSDQPTWQLNTAPGDYSRCPAGQRALHGTPPEFLAPMNSNNMVVVFHNWHSRVICNIATGNQERTGTDGFGLVWFTLCPQAHLVTDTCLWDSCWVKRALKITPVTPPSLLEQRGVEEKDAPILWMELALSGWKPLWSIFLCFHSRLFSKSSSLLQLSHKVWSSFILWEVSRDHGPQRNIPVSLLPTLTSVFMSSGSGTTYLSEKPCLTTVLQRVGPSSSDLEKCARVFLIF